MSELARSYVNGEIDSVSKEDVIRGRDARTTDREFREIKFRIEELTNKQLAILANGDGLQKKQIALLGMCKLYSFIRDFVVEVLREKALVFDYQITEGEYTTFFRRKSESHPELDGLADSTAKKIKQVTFKILEQAGLIDNTKSKKISPQIVDGRVIRAVVEDDPEWLKIYLLSDMEVANKAS
ncbi:hypothetical protein BH24BAC1_BH24BAC1_32490 [soil metagenome]